MEHGTQADCEFLEMEKSNFFLADYEWKKCYAHDDDDGYTGIGGHGHNHGHEHA